LGILTNACFISYKLEAVIVMKVGVIGVGNMGKNHVRVYSELKGIEEIYVYDTDKEKMKDVERKYDAIPVDSLEQILKKIDAISICVPTKYHFEVAKKVIEMGVPCLIEKPITSSLNEATELLKIKKDGLVVGVGHIERFNPIVKEIKNLMEKPRYIEIKRHNPASSRIKDVGVVLDLMIHDIDLVWNYFLKDKEYEIMAFGDNDVCSVIANFGGCIVSLSSSRVACKKIRSIYVEDENFSIEGNFMNQDVYIYRKPRKYEVINFKYTQENIVEKVLVNKVEPLKVELKTFIDCVRKDREFPVTIEQAVLNLKIVEEILLKMER